MTTRRRKSRATWIVSGCLLLMPVRLAAQKSLSQSAEPELARPHLTVYVREGNGGPVGSMALVTLTQTATQYWQQVTAQGGQANFDNISAGRYSVQVIAGGYKKAVEEIDIIGGGGGETLYISLKPDTGVDPSPVTPGPPVLAPKAQKEMAKALEALRAGKMDESRKHLDTAYKMAPGNPDVNFLFGTYSSQTNDWKQAKVYWEKAVAVYPQHLLAQISLSDALLRENNPKEAVPHLKKALEVDANSWRAHAYLADASLRLGSWEESAREAEKAITLGRERADIVQRVLAKALEMQGKKDQAIQVLEAYLKAHPGDADAQKELSALRVAKNTSSLERRAPAAGGGDESSAPAGTMATNPLSIIPPRATPLPSNWLPADIDEKTPPADTDVSCKLDDVLLKAGKRVQEFIHAVDHFSATESLFHEAVNPWGLAALPETRKFNYVASVQEIRPGILNVSEYRDGSLGYDKFPGGVATLGLPSLVLIFHPYNVSNYEMRCEGLAHLNPGGRLAWQVHFKQRPDKPVRDRVYRFGESGVAYPVALRGRAWIDAETFQVVRLETDLVAPLPEIRLLADHTILEYGAVHFEKDRVDMWLPRTAEVYTEIRDRRTHRRHTFSDYLLFSVDDRQKINTPKTEPAGAPGRTLEGQAPSH